MKLPKKKVIKAFNAYEQAYIIAEELLNSGLDPPDGLPLPPKDLLAATHRLFRHWHIQAEPYEPPPE